MKQIMITSEPLKLENNILYQFFDTLLNYFRSSTFGSKLSLKFPLNVKVYNVNVRDIKFNIQLYMKFEIFFSNDIMGTLFLLAMNNIQ